MSRTYYTTPKELKDHGWKPTQACVKELNKFMSNPPEDLMQTPLERYGFKNDLKVSLRPNWKDRTIIKKNDQNFSMIELRELKGAFIYTDKRYRYQMKTCKDPNKQSKY